MSRRWSRHPHALWRRCGRSVVVSVPGSDDVLLLTGTGGVTWELLVEPISDADLVMALAECFETDTELVESELEPFLQQLMAAGAVASTR